MLSNVLSAVAVLALLATPALAAPPNCNGKIRERREWRTLSPSQKTTYFNAFKSYIATGRYEEYSNTHQLHNNYIHGNPLFLPWHRAFTVELEVALRQYAGEDFALPYWDWGYDSQAPELAPIWGDDSLSFGRGNGCVQTGAFAGRRTQYPSRGACLRREWAHAGGTRMDPVTSTERLNSIMSRSTRYDQFRVALETTPHGGVHVAIGGDMGVMTSPNDPVFFMHHAMVDKIWNDWQKLSRSNFDAYDGTQALWDASSRRVRGSGPASKEHDLVPYAGWKVKHTFDTEALCFRYVDLNVDDIRVAQLPPPTVSRPTNTVTQPTQFTQPAPVVNTQPVPRPSSPRRDEDDDRRRPSRDDDREEHHHGTGHKIKKFFHDLFNGPEADPSQLPNGQTTPPEPAPIDNKVAMDYKEDAPAQAVAADDRSELVKLRPQPAIPEAWYKANGIDYEVAKKHEAEHYAEIQKLNSIFGYISPSALWNQINKLARLTAHDIRSFKATISSVIVTVENTASEKVKSVSDKVSQVKQEIVQDIKEVKQGVKDIAQEAYQAAVDIQARIKYSLGLKYLQNIEKAKAAVTVVIGKPVYSEKLASNPYRARHSKV